MEEFWQLSMPWWHFVLRAVFVYGVLLLFVRLSGKRALGQFTPFDMVLLVLLGTAVQNSLIGEDTSAAIALKWAVASLGRSRKLKASQPASHSASA